MAANETKDIHLEKLENDWKQVPQFAKAGNIPRKRNENGKYEKRLLAKCR